MYNYQIFEDRKRPDWYNEDDAFGMFAKQTLGSANFLPIKYLPTKNQVFIITWYNTSNHNIYKKLKERTLFIYQKDFNDYVSKIIELIHKNIKTVPISYSHNERKDDIVCCVNTEEKGASFLFVYYVDQKRIHFRTVLTYNTSDSQNGYTLDLD